MEALALASGGIDSTAMLYLRRDNIKKVMFVYYGSKHNEMEVKYLEETCLKLELPVIFISAQDIFNKLKSSLMRGGDALPKNISPSHSDQKSTVVPFRNGILLSIGVAHAFNNNLSHVFIGSNKEDETIYPDCRATFLDTFSRAAWYGTETKVSVFAPLNHLTKKEIIERVKEHNDKNDFWHKMTVDLSTETYSCYEGETEHCGKCGACMLRKEVLKGMDNTIYKE